jgi:hypothetical protein
MQNFIYHNINHLYAYGSILVKVLVLFFTPVQGIILLVALSTIIDTMFGVWRAKKTKIKINSKTLRHGLVPKLLSYVGLVMFIYTSDYFILNELFLGILSVQYVSTKIVALVLVGIEIRSWDESFIAVRGYSFLQKMVGMVNKFKNIKKQIDETK